MGKRAVQTASPGTALRKQIFTQHPPQAALSSSVQEETETLKDSGSSPRKGAPKSRRGPHFFLALLCVDWVGRGSYL